MGKHLTAAERLALLTDTERRELRERFRKYCAATTRAEAACALTFQDAELLVALADEDAR